MKVERGFAPLPVDEESRLSPEEREKLKDVARQFESVFLNQVVGAMRKTIQPSGFLPQGQGEKIYTEMLDSEYSQTMAQSDQFGVSELLYQHLLRSAEGR